MKSFAFAVAIAFLAASPALADTQHLKGKAADDFIAKYFPSASIPGPVKGSFHYFKLHRRHLGQASCMVPAMGARSDGAVSQCTVDW